MRRRGFMLGSAAAWPLAAHAGMRDLPRSRRVLSAMTTVFGSAIPCSRAARFGVSPTTACS